MKLIVFTSFIVCTILFSWTSNKKLDDWETWVFALSLATIFTFAIAKLNQLPL